MFLVVMVLMCLHVCIVTMTGGYHGRRKVLQVGGAQLLVLLVYKHSMLFLGGLGACPPRKICKNRHQEIEFGGNLASINKLA